MYLLNIFISWTHVSSCNWISYNLSYHYVFWCSLLFLFRLFFCVLWIYSQSSLSTSLLSDIRYPRVILYIPHPRLGIKHLFKKPWFILVSKSMYNKISTRWAQLLLECCCLQVLLVDRAREHTHTLTHTYFLHVHFFQLSVNTLEIVDSHS